MKYFIIKCPQLKVAIMSSYIKQLLNKEIKIIIGGLNDVFNVNI